MRIDTQIRKISEKINNIDSMKADLDAIKDDCLTDLWYLKSAGFVKCSTINKPIKQHR